MTPFPHQPTRVLICSYDVYLLLSWTQKSPYIDSFCFRGLRHDKIPDSKLVEMVAVLKALVLGVFQQVATQLPKPTICVSQFPDCPKRSKGSLFSNRLSVFPF